MRKIAILSLLCSLPLLANLPQKADDYFRESRQQIGINNWVLACPNGEPITVMDLAKRMTMIFNQQYPDYANSIQARYQFFNASWRPVLDEMINNELILADAEEKKVEVSDGEVRYAMEEKYGPNVVIAIDRIDATYQEVYDMMREQLIVDRMQGALIHSKAIAELTPDRIREAYGDLVKQALENDEWRYQVLTLRHKKAEQAELAAQRAQYLLQEGMGLAQVVAAIRDEAATGELFSHVRVSLSDVEQRSVTTLAKGHRDVITALQPGEYSEATSQHSRADNSMVYRIFALHDRVIPEPPSLSEMEERIKNELFARAAAIEHGKYITKLRKHFQVSADYMAQMIPEDFQPFKLN